MFAQGIQHSFVPLWRNPLAWSIVPGAGACGSGWGMGAMETLENVVSLSPSGSSLVCSFILGVVVFLGSFNHGRVKKFRHDVLYCCSRDKSAARHVLNP